MEPNYPQNPNYYPGPAALPTSTMAIVSLISGIVGLTIIPFIGSIIAIVTGQSARAETRSNPPRASGDGLATAGIIMGWIGVVLGGLGLCAACAAFALPFILGVPFLFATGGG
jgi:hypothetical protein